MLGWKCPIPQSGMSKGLQPELHSIMNHPVNSGDLVQYIYISPPTHVLSNSYIFLLHGPQQSSQSGFGGGPFVCSFGVLVYKCPFQPVELAQEQWHVDPTEPGHSLGGAVAILGIKHSPPPLPPHGCEGKLIRSS